MRLDKGRYIKIGALICVPFFVQILSLPAFTANTHVLQFVFNIPSALHNSLCLRKDVLRQVYRIQQSCPRAFALALLISKAQTHIV